MNFDRVLCTGDVHGNFEWLPEWCEREKTSKKDALIILGDASFMYEGPESWCEQHRKALAQNCPITILCVRGNHEARPANYDTTKFALVNEDPCVPDGYYYEPNYPDIWYISDGSVLNINGRSCLFIGGAYSVDKEYRLLTGQKWFSDEELTQEEQMAILDKIDHKHYDFVFTHTCPENWQPTDLFMPGLDQSKISKKMEQFLTTVSEITDFDFWLFGHFHDNRLNMDIERTHPGQGQVYMLFDNIQQIM